MILLFFRYIYGGKLSLEEYDTLDIVKILVAANELSLQELVNHLQSFLIKNKTDWMEKNFNLIYQKSFENNSFLELQKYCTNLISEDPDKIFESLDFSTIPENLLISTIQCDNLQMDEVQIWEHVLKWGLAQNPGLSSDHSTYSKDDFNSLKNTLQHCIPFIRFYNLTSKEFSDKVLPHKKVLPKELYKDLLSTFLNLHPDSKPINKSKPRITKKPYNKTKLEYKREEKNNDSKMTDKGETSEEILTDEVAELFKPRSTRSRFLNEEESTGKEPELFKPRSTRSRFLNEEESTGEEPELFKPRSTRSRFLNDEESRRSIRRGDLIMADKWRNTYR
jgi:hypothetical protein